MELLYYESTSDRRLGIGMAQRGKSAVKVGQCAAQDLASLGAASTETGLDFEGRVETVWSDCQEQEKSYGWANCEGLKSLLVLLLLHQISGISVRLSFERLDE